jgi:hypothetical protein
MIAQQLAGRGAVVEVLGCGPNSPALGSGLVQRYGN